MLSITVQYCCSKGDPFQGPKLGSCLTLRKELSEETHVLRQQEILLERARGWRAAGSGNPGEQLCQVVCMGFMVMGLVSRLSLAFYSDWESSLVVHTLFSQDGCQREGFWEVVDLSRTLPVGGGLLLLCSLPGPPVVKQLMQIVTMVPGQGGQFQSVCFP